MPPDGCSLTRSWATESKRLSVLPPSGSARDSLVWRNSPEQDDLRPLRDLLNYFSHEKTFKRRPLGDGSLLEKFRQLGKPYPGPASIAEAARDYQDTGFLIERIGRLNEETVVTADNCL